MKACPECETPGWVLRLIALGYTHWWRRLGRVQIGLWPFRWRWTGEIMDRPGMRESSGLAHIFTSWRVLGPVEIRVFTLPLPQSISHPSRSER